MAHLTIQYSIELQNKYDFSNFVDKLRNIMIKTEVFPIGGIRVRAWATEKYAIADGHNKNRYVDLQIRMGIGRSLKEKQKVGKKIMSYSKIFFKNEIRSEYFALALEIIEIDPHLSWKFNTIHSRISKL